MRVFLAVSCGEQLTAAVTTALDNLRAGPVDSLPVRWTRPETWHLTLQFLGDWPADRLAGLQTALEAASDQSAFSLTPGRLGGFPDLKSPRVLFLHMDDDGQAARLAGSVRTIVNKTWREGPQDNRAFRAHLTLARIRAKLSRSDFNLLQKLKLDGLPDVAVEGFSLVASELRPEGPRYTELAFFGLRK
ncbi:MAG: RNA 2',3'-cyclic phosphodiesterase [Candidatus Krumholzibacteria bacterium]|nr:RNA 2',3'-cyclic phosphodiesterase [Candidatus Krumholzibacteria bacterium]